MASGYGVNRVSGKPNSISKAAVWYAVLQMLVYMVAAFIVMLLPLKSDKLAWFKEFGFSVPLVVFALMIVFAALHKHKIMLLLGIAGLLIDVLLASQVYMIMTNLDAAKITEFVNNGAFWAVVTNENNYSLYAFSVLAGSIVMLIFSSIYTGISGMRVSSAVSRKKPDAPSAESATHTNSGTGGLNSPW